jgi:hypothetical protein
MAFRKDKTTAAQTAANVAGNVVSALIAAGAINEVAKAKKAVVDVFTPLFETLSPIVDADNEVFAAAEAADPTPKSSSRAGSGAGSGRAAGASKSGATKKASVGSGGSPDDPGSIKLDRGFFKGLTLAEVENLDEAEAAGYGYERGAGSAYIDYLVGDQNRNTFLRDMATKMREGA